MNRVTLVGRLAAVVGLLALLAVATAAPAIPASPDAGTLAVGAGAQVWNGHNCSAPVPINVSGLGAGLGGYESKLSWAAGRFSSLDADISINIGTYLTNGGTRSQTGDSSTPALKAVSTDAVKWGGYSWGTGNPPGNMADGLLSTVSLKPTATCGTVAMTLAETQLVDINGAVIALTAQNGGSVAVFSRYDVNGLQSTINTGDVNAVVGKLGQSVGGTCGVNYRYDVNLLQSTINTGDVNAVVAKLGQLTSAVCTS